MSWTGFMFGVCAVSIVAMIWRYVTYKGVLRNKIKYPTLYGKASTEDIERYKKIDKLFVVFASSAALSFVLFCASIHN